MAAAILKMNSGWFLDGGRQSRVLATRGSAARLPLNEFYNLTYKRHIYSISKLTGAKKKHKQNISSFLWHKRLRHISKSRMQGLIR
ncbi:hypothetical protein OSB04_002843 [Centaurea solstitialis]|uniref:Uncharacterized protein n=1 Tax=Centaurea solstitialis TaxID=347529 RepID=A0AA38UB77_9ASTR|nr:hypothetical protein OSB04_002843 [Centaurea solstitialis]